MAHFVVENELGISGGVFGQLAEGGHANMFRPVGERPRTVVAASRRRVDDGDVAWGYPPDGEAPLATRVSRRHVP